MAYRPRKVTPLADRFAAMVAKGAPDDCWPWLGFIRPNGYAIIGLGRRGDGYDYVHRIAYRLAKGKIPKGYEIDHTCHDPTKCSEPGKKCPHRRCCNPAHLAAVRPQENLARRAPRRATNTHCIHGHPFSPETDYVDPRGKRRCGPCRKDGRKKAA